MPKKELLTVLTHLNNESSLTNKIRNPSPTNIKMRAKKLSNKPPTSPNIKNNIDENKLSIMYIKSKESQQK